MAISKPFDEILTYTRDSGGNRESLAKHLSSAYKLKMTYDEAWEAIE